MEDWFLIYRFGISNPQLQQATGVVRYFTQETAKYHKIQYMKINKTEDFVEVIVPVKKYYSHIFVFGLGGVITISFCIFFLLKSIIFSHKFHFEQIGSLILGFIFLNYALWLIAGNEKMHIYRDSILITKTNKLITLKKTYEINKIIKITKREKQYKSESFLDERRERIKEKQRAFPFWQNMGRISFSYKTNGITIFSGLDDSELEIVYKLLKEKVELKIG